MKLRLLSLGAGVQSTTVAEILARRTAHLDTAAVRVGLGLESSDG